MVLRTFPVMTRHGGQGHTRPFIPCRLYAKGQCRRALASCDSNTPSPATPRKPTRRPTRRSNHRSNRAFVPIHGVLRCTLYKPAGSPPDAVFVRHGTRCSTLSTGQKKGRRGVFKGRSGGMREGVHAVSGGVRLKPGTVLHAFQGFTIVSPTIMGNSLCLYGIRFPPEAVSSVC